MSKYEFGTASNSYFNGSDGTITRVEDGKTIRVRRDDGLMSICVKEHSFGLRKDAPEDVKQMVKELPRVVNEFGDRVSFDEYEYDDVRRHWWEYEVAWFFEEDEERPTWIEGYYSSGRSGGWLVVEGSRWLAENFYSTSEYTAKVAEFIDREDFEAAIKMRDEFCDLAFSIAIDSIAGAHEHLEERVREAYGELQQKREMAIVRGDN